MEKLSYYLHQRQAKLRDVLKKQRLDAIFITNTLNLRYLSGYTGDDALGLITPQESFFYTDFRNSRRASEEVVGFEIKLVKENTYNVLKTDIKKLCDKRKNIGIETLSITLDKYERLSKEITVRIEKTRNIIESIRMLKDDYEISRIRKAAKITSKTYLSVMRSILSFDKIYSEKNVQEEIESVMKDQGADGTAFGTIVASGENSAMPHPPPPGNKKIRKGILLLDFGTKYHNYCSDLTRTGFLGKLDARNEGLEKLYNIVLTAQKKAISRIKPGISVSEIDKTAREYIEKAGYGSFFGHALGHGIGMAVHEMPKISASSDRTIQKGMVFSVEPGIYIPGKGGVRIEDMVLVTEDGCEVLTNEAKK